MIRRFRLWVAFQKFDSNVAGSWDAPFWAFALRVVGKP